MEYTIINIRAAIVIEHSSNDLNILLKSIFLAKDRAESKTRMLYCKRKKLRLVRWSF